VSNLEQSVGWGGGLGSERDGCGLAEEWVGCCPPPKPYLPSHGNEMNLFQGRGWAGGRENQSCLLQFSWVSQNLGQPKALVYFQPPSCSLFEVTLEDNLVYCRSSLKCLLVLLCPFLGGKAMEMDRQKGLTGV